MQFGNGFFEWIGGILNYNLFPLGDAKITLLSLIYLVVFSIALFWVSRKLRDFLTNRILAKTHLDTGAQTAIGTISRYFVLFLGFLVIMQTVGIDLTTLNVLAGAVGIGVGFGLQNIASNFISGLIILFERPVKVGDRIEIGTVTGKVVSVGARSTVVKTNDNISIIVPNTKFIAENVVNWTYDGRQPRVRFRLPVKVAYDSDVALVESLMLEVAEQNADVLPEPAPAVRLRNFEDGAISLELWAWSRTKLHRKGVLTSDLNFAILNKFRQNGIQLYSSDSSSASKTEAPRGGISLVEKTNAAESEKVN